MVDALQRCDRVFGSSRSVVDRLTERSGLNEVSVFANAVPSSDTTNALAATTPRLAWAARLVPDKDPKILLQVSNTLHQEGLRFNATIAGSPLPHQQWYADELSTMVDELCLSDIVDMPGWVDDAPALFRSAAIGVQTSYTEGLSMTLLEQMMAGLAIVATDVGDTAVAIEHEKTGLLIPPGEPQALTDALRRLITEPALRQRLGHAAREKALSEFSLEAMAQRVLRDLGITDKSATTCAQQT
jgi:glycosyltransferase involved in cell wall biosynthesis